MRKNIVGNNVRTIRERLGITQEDPALKSGLTQGYINFLENGKRGYRGRSLEKIANALGIQISGLFEEKIKEEPTITKKPPSWVANIYGIRPLSLKLTYCAFPMIIWSRSFMPTIFPASTSRLVICMSSLLGSGSPEG